jgi:hypothetical protein
VSEQIYKTLLNLLFKNTKFSSFSSPSMAKFSLIITKLVEAIVQILKLTQATDSIVMIDVVVLYTKSQKNLTSTGWLIKGKKFIFRTCNFMPFIS